MIRRFDDQAPIKPSLSPNHQAESPPSGRSENRKRASSSAELDSVETYAPVSKRAKRTRGFAEDALNRPGKTNKNSVPAAIRRTTYASSLEAMRVRWSRDYFTFQKPLVYFTDPSNSFFMPCRVFYQQVMNSNWCYTDGSLADFYQTLSICLIEVGKTSSVELGSIQQTDEDSSDSHKLYGLMRFPGGDNGKVLNEDELDHLATAEYCFRNGIIVPQNHLIADALLCQDPIPGATAALHQAILDKDLAMICYLIELGASLFGENSDDNLTSLDLLLKSDKQDVFNQALSKVSSKDEIAGLALVLRYEAATLTEAQKTAITTKLHETL